MNPRAKHFRAEEIDLRTVSFTPELLASIPAEFANRYGVLPIGTSQRLVRVALADPSDLKTLDALSHLLGREVELCVADADQIDEFIGRLYGSEGTV